MLNTLTFVVDHGIRSEPVVDPHIVGASLVYVLVVVVNCSACTIVIVHSATGPPVSRGSPRSVFALKRCLGHRRCKDHPLLCKRTCASGMGCRPSESKCCAPRCGRNTPICRRIRGRSTSRGSTCHVICRGGSLICTRGVFFPHVCSSHTRRIHTCRS